MNFPKLLLRNAKMRGDLPAVRDTATTYLPWMLLLPLTASAGFWLDGVFVGATRARAMRNTMMVATALFFPVWWLTTGWGNHGIRGREPRVGLGGTALALTPGRVLRAVHRHPAQGREDSSRAND